MLTPPDARRAKLMIDGGLLWLDDNGKLQASRAVGRKGKGYVLRYYDEREEQWLDPIPKPPSAPQSSQG